MQIRIADVYAERLTVDDAISHVLSYAPDLLGVSITSANILEARDFLAGVKTAKPDIITVGGGIHPTLFDELMLREIPHVDFILRGEADLSFPELCTRLSKGQSLDNLPGLSYRSRGAIVRGEPQHVQDIDALPPIDRALLDRSLYGTQWYGWKLPDLAGRITTAFTSRGCPFNCMFCSMVALCKRQFRARSAENVFQELRQIADQGFEVVIFFDDNFTVRPERVRELCDKLLEQPLGLRFGFAGTLHLLPQPLLNLMQRAGFDVVFIGVESGSEAVLAAYRKPAGPDDIAAGILRAKKAHMITIASFITGAPTETESDFRQTLDFVRAVRSHFCDINPLMVHPGSPLWEDLHGPENPSKLEDSVSRPIWRFPSGVDDKVVQHRIEEFRSLVFQSYKGILGLAFWRIAAILDHLIYNKSARKLLRFIIRNFRTVLHPGDETGSRN